MRGQRKNWGGRTRVGVNILNSRSCKSFLLFRMKSVKNSKNGLLNWIEVNQTKAAVPKVNQYNYQSKMTRIRKEFQRNWFRSSFLFSNCINAMQESFVWSLLLWKIKFFETLFELYHIGWPKEVQQLQHDDQVFLKPWSILVQFFNSKSINLRHG